MNQKKMMNAQDVRNDRERDEHIVRLVGADVAQRHHGEAKREDEARGGHLHRPAAEGQADQAGRDLAAGELHRQQQRGHGIDDEGHHRRRERPDDGPHAVHVVLAEQAEIDIGNEFNDYPRQDPGRDQRQRRIEPERVLHEAAQAMADEPAHSRDPRVRFRRSRALCPLKPACGRERHE
jgi:hypothetical protein